SVRIEEFGRRLRSHHMTYRVICAAVLLLSSPSYAAHISAKALVRAQCIVACGPDATHKLVRQCVHAGVTADGESSVCGPVCPSTASPSGAFLLAEADADPVRSLRW